MDDIWPVTPVLVHSVFLSKADSFLHSHSSSQVICIRQLQYKIIIIDVNQLYDIIQMLLLKINYFIFISIQLFFKVDSFLWQHWNGNVMQSTSQKNVQFTSTHPSIKGCAFWHNWQYKIAQIPQHADNDNSFGTNIRLTVFSPFKNPPDNYRTIKGAANVKCWHASRFYENYLLYLPLVRLISATWKQKVEKKY